MSGRFKTFLAIALSVFFCANAARIFPALSAEAPFATKAPRAILVDAESGATLFHKAVE